jgi:hypothetical protein
MQPPRASIVAAYASILNALEGADARTVMLKMSAAGQLLGATEAELAAALASNGASGSAPAPSPAPATVEKKPPKRGLKRKAVEPPAPGTKFLGKHVRVWWGAPYNAFYVGHVVDYQPGSGYRVVYNEGSPDEEHAQEDLDAMAPLSCKIVPAPKSAPTSRGAVQQPMELPTKLPSVYNSEAWKAFLKDKNVRIDRARSLEEITAVANELDAGTVHLKAMIEALGPDSDSDEEDEEKEDDADGAGAVGGDADAVALLATRQATELGLDLDETLCDAGVPVAASPEAGARTPRDMSVIPTLLQTATPVQPLRETPTSARALAAIQTPADNDYAAPQGNDSAPPDDDGSPHHIIVFVPEQVAAVPEPELQLDVRDAPHDEETALTLARDDAPLEPELEAAPEDL